jgi:hypothetical protein
LLDRECADRQQLRERLDQLIAAHLQSNALLDAPAVEQTADHTPSGTPTVSIPSSAEAIGTIIAGRYKLLEEIGEGGMGTVWVAEQTQPVRRKVALKLIKAGMDSRQVLARFEAERQALAVMDHPNIAKVLDGGLTDAGRPFFVMEYVKGVPITEYCDTARQRAGAFEPLRAGLPGRAARAPEGDHPPRFEAFKHPGGALRRQARAEDHRLWPGQGDAPVAHRAHAPHGARNGARHSLIHEPRAGAAQQSRHRYTKRYLLAWRASL